MISVADKNSRLVQSPCFCGDALVVAKSGFVPLSEIVIGDKVLTHMGRWRKVFAICKENSETVTLYGQGQSSGVVAGSGCLFYARKTKIAWVGRENGGTKRVFLDPEWVSSVDMKGKFWATPVKWPSASVPEIISQGNEADISVSGAAFMRLLGRWLGDGWTRIARRRICVIICCSKKESHEIVKLMQDAGLHYSRVEQKTAFRFQVSSSALAKWIHSHFGKGAAEKTVPIWIFGLCRKFREAFLNGYLSADGCDDHNKWRAATISRKIALGVVLLAGSLGVSVSRRWSTDRRVDNAIDGRVIKSCGGFWQVAGYKKSRSSTEIGGCRWGLIRSVDNRSTGVVYGLSVEEDHSYVVDGFVVHDCQKVESGSV